MSESSDTYQRILESAKELIYAKSYADVGVAAICDRAQVKKGSFYHFFPSKQDLTLAVIEAFYVEFKTALIDKAFDSSLTPLKRLERVLDLSIEFQENIYQQTGQVYGCPFGNLATEVSTQNEKLRRKLDSVFKKLQNQVRDTLQEAVADQSVANIDVDKTAQAFMAMFEGCMLLAKTQNDPSILRQVLPAAAHLKL